MMTVKRWSRGPARSQIGKPAVHMASVDLKGKAYEYKYESISILFSHHFFLWALGFCPFFFYICRMLNAECSTALVVFH